MRYLAIAAASEVPIKIGRMTYFVQLDGEAKAYRMVWGKRRRYLVPDTPIFNQVVAKARLAAGEAARCP